MTAAGDSTGSSPQVSTRTSCSSMLRMAASELSTTSSPVSGCVMTQLVEFRCPRTRNLGSKALYHRTKTRASGLEMTPQSFRINKNGKQRWMILLKPTGTLFYEMGER